jgi:multidrug resistance efflux pump
MSDHALPYLGDLRETVVDWRKLRKALLSIALFGAVGGMIYYAVASSSTLVLQADGYITRERIAVAPSFEGRITDIFVKPGDRVEKGQMIAVVNSVTIGRTMSELAAERARSLSRIAQLEARQRVLQETMALAEQNADKASAYLKDLNIASAKGFVVSRSMQEMTAAALTATEHYAGLKAEKIAIETELAAHKSALTQTNSALDGLGAAYSNGLLYANASGEIGASLARVGEVVTTANGPAVAEILTGEQFGLVIVPDSYLFDVSVGQPVRVTAGNLTMTGRIDRLLPFAASPPLSGRSQGQSRPHGRMVRIALPTGSALAVDQHIRVTNCLFSCEGRSFAEHLPPFVVRLAGRLQEVSLSAATSVLRTLPIKLPPETPLKTADKSDR